MTDHAPAARRLWLERLGVALFGLALALLLIEILLRVGYRSLPAFPQWALRDLHRTPFSEERMLPVALWQQDPYYGVISRQNNQEELYVLSTNGALAVITSNWIDVEAVVGFRAPEPHWQPRQPLDVAAVGDSFTFCYTDWADCWVTRLAEAHDLSIANLGQVSTGAISHLRILRDFGMASEPRIVLWQWYGNDFSDDYWLNASGQSADPGIALATAFGCVDRSGVARWLRDNSGVYTIMMSYLCVQNVGHAGTHHLVEGRLDLYFGDPYTRRTFDLAETANREGVALTQEAIREAWSLSESQGAALVVILIPAKEEVYRRWTEKMLGADYLDMLGEGRREMLAFCEAEGLLCLDVTDALTRYANQGEQLYWAEDLHLNVRGNEVLAEAVGNFLADHGLVSPG